MSTDIPPAIIIPPERLVVARARRKKAGALQQMEDVLHCARSMQADLEATCAILERLSSEWTGVARRHEAMERLCARCQEIAGLGDFEEMVRQRDALIQEHQNLKKARSL